MKSLLAGVVLSLTLAAHPQAADNLLINGDFSTGTLAPWTPTGTVQVATLLCLLQGESSISQIITTNAGSRYYIAADGANGQDGFGPTFVLKATGNSGAGQDDVTAEFLRTENQLRRFSTIFTASSSSTRISISNASDNALGVLDNIAVYELVVPSPFAGTYSGSVSIALAGGAAQTKGKAPASAQIDSDGRVVLLEGTARVHGGIIFDDQSADFHFGGEYTAPTAISMRGSNLSLTFTEVPMPSQDEGNNAVQATRTLKFNLKRKGR